MGHASWQTGILYVPTQGRSSSAEDQRPYCVLKAKLREFSPGALILHD
jgi:hypothetical protein